MNTQSKIIASVGIMLFAATASFGQQVKTDYDRKTDFSQYRTYSWAIQVESGIGIPSGEHRQGSPVSHPRIKLRHIDDVSLPGFDDDRFPLRFHLLLSRGVQIPSLFGAVAHGLNRPTQFLLLVDIRVAQLGGPGEVAAHVGEDRWKLGQRLDARVPRLFVYFLGQLPALQTLMLPHPLRGFQ